MNEKEIKKSLEAIRDVKTKEMEEQNCNPEFYKNKLLQFAIASNISHTCILRTYIEGLHTAAKINAEKGIDTLDNLHANYLLRYSNMYLNKKQIKLIDTVLSEFANAEMPEERIMSKLKGRFKSFLSVENKLRAGIIKLEVTLYMQKHLTELCPEFSEEELKIAAEMLKKWYDDFNKENLLNDVVGYRFILRAVNVSQDEKLLTKGVYNLAEHFEEHVRVKGYRIIDRKDYISNPKPKTKYQSLHQKVDILSWTVEIQYRTTAMDKFAETGDAAHKEYKYSSPIYMFLETFLKEESKKHNKVEINIDNGIIEPFDIRNPPIIYNTKADIPATPEEIRDFVDKELLKEIFS